MFKKLIKSISIGVIMSFVVAALPMPAHAAGTPHTSYGLVLSGQTTDNWTLYVVARPSETITGTISESGGNYFYQAQVGNLTTAWNDNDDSLVFVARETNAGANNHAGYYAVMNEDLDVTTNPQQYNDCTVRQIPVPTGAQGGTGIDLTWSAAATDTSETPQGNNVAGYNVYRSTSQSSGFTQINGSTVSSTNYTDTTGTTGTTYYYTIEPVFRGGVALGVYSANSNGVVFPDVSTPLNITTTGLPGGSLGTAYNQTVTATGGTTPYTWSISVGALPDGLSLNASSGVISGTPTVANVFIFTVQVQDAAMDTDTQALSITISDVPPGDPDITLVTPTTAEIGQTLVIDGANFGATQGTSVVRFGTTMGNATSWADDQIIVAVPSDPTLTGDVVVTVDVGGTTDTETITITGEKIYVDDFEGGAVNCFSPSVDSLYFVFADVEDITPIDADINDDLRSTEDVHERTYSAKVRYSFVGTDGSDWGGGWGAKLANALDLDATYAVDLFIKWDGTSNNITLNFKDGGDTVNEADISNAVLLALGAEGGTVRLYKSNFSVTEDGDDGVFDWTDVAGYNLVYKGEATTTNYHYIDALVGIMGTTGGPEISTIIPAAGPAGTRITVSGIGFGSNQSLSMLMFENTTTGAAYQAEVLEWREDQIVAIVPRLAEKGDYEVRVIKIAIVAGSTTAQESNEEAFRVTAGGASEGGLATIYPNPFNPIAEQTGQPNAAAIKATTIAFDPGSATNVGVYIYDMTARLVYREVTSDSQVTWSGYDTHGNVAGDGAYILRVIDEDSKRVIAKGKILVIKQ